MLESITIHSKQKITLARSKWQQRIMLTLVEANCPLTIRDITIRCGKIYDSQDAFMRNTLTRMRDRGMIDKVGLHSYTLV